MKKVMLADDEEDVLALVTATLEGDPQYVILVARDGEEALEIARRERPDLLFLDILMPKKDGYEVCRALKASSITAGTKIVMLTALAQESDREKAIQAGADGYFTKPFSPTALLQKVEELITFQDGEMR